MTNKTGPLALLAALAGCVAQPHPPTLRQLYGLAPPARLDAARTALLLIDAQREYSEGRLALPGLAPAVARAGELLAWARGRRLLVVHVLQVPRDPAGPLFTPGSPRALPIAGLEPRAGEWVVGKPGGGAFSAADLDARLRAAGIDRLVVAGFMTHLAVTSTAAAAAQLGYGVIVAADATATRDLPPAGEGAAVPARAVQRATLAALGDRFADVMETGRIVGLAQE